MNTPFLSDILKLEQSVWDALVSGDPAADARLLSADFLGVYASGFSDRAGHVGQLADGPSVGQYHLSETQMIVPAEGLALLCYRAEFTRAHSEAALETMLVSSLWKETPNGWINIFSQDTPVDPDLNTSAVTGDKV